MNYLYRHRVTYFERHVLSNHPYNYRLISSESPHNFIVQLNDPIGQRYAEELDKRLAGIAASISNGGNDLLEEFRLSDSEIYLGMPVLTSGSQVEVANDKILLRGEVRDIDDDLVYIQLVDVGRNVIRKIGDVMALTVELLEIPKLVHACSLPVNSATGTEWTKGENWASHFTGVETQTITFINRIPRTQLFEVDPHVDTRSVIMKLMHTGLAVPRQLSFSNKYHPYPVLNYTAWTGFKTCVYGVDAFIGNYSNGQRKCKVVLQMDPDTFNLIRDKIANYIQVTPAHVKNRAFKLEKHTPCLAPYNGEYFRAVILENKEKNRIRIAFVDYKTKRKINKSKLIAIPNELVAYPECAVICQLHELLTTNQTVDLQNITENVVNKDLYAVVERSDQGKYGDELLVSLYEPTDFNGCFRTFFEVLEISDPPTTNHRVLQEFQRIPDGNDPVINVNKFPPPTVFHEGAKVTLRTTGEMVIICCLDLPMNPSITAEMNSFYFNGGVPADVIEEFRQAPDKVGMYVAAEAKDDIGRDAMFRCRVIQARPNNKLFLLFLDYGETREVDGEEVFPLHRYFVKNQTRVLETNLKQPKYE